MKEGILKETRHQGEIRLVYLILFSDLLIFTTKKEREEGEGHRFVVLRVEILGSIRAEDQELGNGISPSFLSCRKKRRSYGHRIR